MNSSHPISLQFGQEVREPVRSRIEYAFRVFAAIYNHPVIAGEAGGSAIRCFYGQTAPRPEGAQLFHIPSLYREGLADGKKVLMRRRYAGEDIYLSYGLDVPDGRPDWLGEIFLWLSSSHEVGITARDAVGRIPYSEMIFGREGLSPRKPYAAQLMAWLENALHNGNAKEMLPKAPSPVTDVEHLVVCSHDIDFYYVDRYSALVRLVKNLGTATLLYKSMPFFLDNLKMLLGLIGGKRPGKYLPALRRAAGGEFDFGTTMFVVTRQGHRRDPNYRMQQIADQLPGAAEKGLSVEVHGSYRSVIEDQTLAEEARELGDLIGRKPLGNRQHWLRFAEHQVLLDEIERAELIADSTLGFSDEVGFRNGACFAFPPYNFAKERPCNFLEIPLVLMDGGLEVAARSTQTAPQKVAEEVLRESRKYGWGGVSVLWHNPMEQLSVPAEINDVFWECAKQKEKFREKWVSLEQFLTCCEERYQKAGLLTSPLVGIEEGDAGS